MICSLDSGRPTTERQCSFRNCGAVSRDSVADEFWLCNHNTVLALMLTPNVVAGALESCSQCCGNLATCRMLA